MKKIDCKNILTTRKILQKIILLASTVFTIYLSIYYYFDYNGMSLMLCTKACQDKHLIYIVYVCAMSWLFLETWHVEEDELFWHYSPTILNLILKIQSNIVDMYACVYILIFWMWCTAFHLTKVWQYYISSDFWDGKLNVLLWAHIRFRVWNVQTDKR